ncbi:MAG: hypothetical protein ABIO79_14405 [Ferruginibacter sp.]
MLLKKIPLFLLLLAIFFCLHGTIENYGFLDMGEVMLTGFVIIICTAVLFLLIFLFKRDMLFASLLTFFISLWYLFFGVIHDWIKSRSIFLSFIQSYTVLVPILLICTICWAIWLKRKRPVHQKLFQYLNLLFIIFCVWDGIVLIGKYRQSSEQVFTNAVAFDASKVTHKPNVYFLVFDEYAGYKSLKDSFGFTNDRLYDFLQQKEFTILPTFSNYDYTAFSMASMLNMNYVDSHYNHQLLTQKDVQNRFGEIRNAQVFSIFREMGYRVQNYSIFDIKGEPALSQSNPLFPIHAVLLTNKIFHNRLFKDLGWKLISGRFEIPFVKHHYLYRTDKYNKKAEELVISSSANSQAPQFCYGHFFLPHDPFYLDSTGAYNSPLQMKDLHNKALYLSYLKYSNGVIQNMVTHIVAKDANAIIIVMSDHGFYNYDSPGDDDPNNYDNFCLVRFPKKKYPIYKDKWSNVNFFRYLFNTEFGQNMPYLKDSSIYVNE